MTNDLAKIDREIGIMAEDLALTNNSFYRNDDAPHFKKKLIGALVRGGWTEVNKVKLEIKYAGTDERKAAFMAGREE